MLKSIEIFLNFLLQQDISYKAPNETDTLLQVIDSSFHLLNENILRAMVTCAIKERDANVSKGNISNENLLGSWGDIIDLVKDITEKRKNKATKHFQIIMNLGLKGAEPPKISSCIHKLCVGGHIDYLFTGILEETLNACIKNKDEEHAAMFQYFTMEIARINKELKDAANAVPVIANLLPSTSSSSTAKFNTSGGDSDDNSDDEDDSDDENEDKVKDIELIQDELIKCGMYLNSSIKTSAGDVNKLKSQILHDIRSKVINIELLQIVVRDNLEACKKANYVNKLKLMVSIYIITMCI